MGILDKLFGRKSGHTRQEPRALPPEHAVLVYLPLSNLAFGEAAERDAIHVLSDRLRDAIATASAGEFDGDEFGDGNCTLFMYGPDADRLYACVDPILRASSICAGARVVKRYGGAGNPDARREEIRL